MPLPRILPVTAAVALLALAGCGNSGEEQQASAPAATQTAFPTPDGGKPEVAKPTGEPPRRLVKEDIRAGAGPAARTGQKVMVQYVGVSFKTGKQFDASWDRGEPFIFILGEGRVIQGWDRGIVGMKAGGRRRLVIPPALACGTQGAPPDIGPNETLIFVVDLVAVK